MEHLRTLASRELGLTPAGSVHAANALRLLQQLDEVAPLHRGRELLTAAQTELGRDLGLTCTGADEGGGVFYDHSGDTCPIHEWLVLDDQRQVEELRAARHRAALRDPLAEEPPQPPQPATANAEEGCGELPAARPRDD